MNYLGMLNAMLGVQGGGCIAYLNLVYKYIYELSRYDKCYAGSKENA